jgi:predicted nucleotidyltransferase
MATRRVGSTSFWRKLSNGLWAKPIAERIESALDYVVARLRHDDAVVGVLAFGSYARGDFGRTSDLDLLILLRPVSGNERPEIEQRIVSTVIDAEAIMRLSVHLAPLIVVASNPEELGSSLLHEIWTDSIIFYADAAALATLQPSGLAPWNVIRFSLGGAMPRDRVRLARRLHGTAGRAGAIRLPGLNLARGAAFVPADQARTVRDALDEARASYDLIPVWREV